jgi:hypothetical protein
MLNLLFISDCLKAEYIKSILQPVLKVFIDVVPDFDTGLRDVFEKRPATVFIQHQIGVVTGESVARHIQMLLGSDAPKFILLHSGNDKPKAIKGLYEHFIDVSQPNDVLEKNIISTLKLLLGDQWDKIYLAPADTPVPTEVTAALPVGFPKEHDIHEDETLLNLIPSDFLDVDTYPLVTPTSKNAPLDAPGDAPAATHSGPASSGKVKPPKAPAKTPVVSASHPTSPASDKSGDSSSDNRGMTAKLPSTVSPLPSQPKSQSVPTPAEFRVTKDVIQDEETIPEDLLLAFEENYSGRSRLAGRFATILLAGAVLVGGGWYLFAQNPQVVKSLQQQLASITDTKITAAPTPASVSPPKPVSPSVPQPPVKPSIPSFIPKEGLDTSFTASKPGWERYVGADAEFRLFNSSGRCKAVQVLAVKDRKISESLITSVLQELVGSSHYTVVSQTTKAGVRVEKGLVDTKGDVVLYKRNGSVIAFVVSLN